MTNQSRISGFREAISPYDEHTHFSFSSTSTNQPPSYQQWPEPDHNVSPQEPVDMNFGSKHEPMGEVSVSPGLETVWAGEGDKEVVMGTALPMATSASGVPPEKKSARVCGLRRGLFLVLLAAALMLAIGLGVGLGVGLGTKHTDKKPSPESAKSSDYYIGGALDPAYFSKEGAFNGSGLALASQSFGSGEYGDLVLYFQHHSGSIRWQRKIDTGNGWLGGTASEVVATDAKNSTPLSAVAYSLNGVSTWHLFYIDNTNQLREKINSNATNIWIEGPVTKGNYTVLDADQVGMQACWYGNDYGDADYKHSPLPNQDNTTTNSTSGSDTDIGMHLWYASDASTFQQLGWRNGDSNWTFQQEWHNKNGHAGLGCYFWGPGTTTYVMMVNLEQTVEVWWKDTNTNTSSTASHPINQWTNSSAAINNVFPSTSLGYTNAFYAQGPDGYITGYNISWASENTTIGNNFAVNQPGILGTHMSVTTLPDPSGGDSLCVFYQENGSDITFATRDLVQGTWTTAPLTVPDS